MLHETILSAPVLFFAAALLVGWLIQSTLRSRREALTDAPLLKNTLPFGLNHILDEMKVSLVK
jgi:hypothetical protein